MALDLVIRNGDIVTAADSFTGDIGIKDGRIAVVGTDLPGAEREIDATRHIVMPGGVDAHCHIEEPPYMGAVLADDFAVASRSAACGGTTTIIPFVTQQPGKRLREVVDAYRERAAARAAIDYAFHIILSDVNQAVLGQELPSLLEDGYRSFKVFMTYPGYMLSDDKIMEVMAATRQHGGTVLVHAENGHCVHWLNQQLENAGRTDIAAYAESAPSAVEREATHRAITLGQVTGARVLLVHVSAAEAMDQIDWAHRNGIAAMAETCPQYLIDQADRLQGAGWEPAKHICSPPPRGGDNAERLWRGVSRGVFTLLSSDHCPYRFEGTDGKRSWGSEPHFRHVPPGVPGMETRLMLLYQEGVANGHISPQQFVALTATNPARTYGLYPRKGTLAPGADADIVLWETGEPRAIRHADLHDACDYSPYEGHKVAARPVVTLSRGEVIWDRGHVAATPGRGRFLKQDPHG